MTFVSISKIMLGFLNFWVGFLFSWVATFVLGGINENTDRQDILILFAIIILVGFTLSFLERYLADLCLLAQLATFALPSVIGTVLVIEFAVANRIAIGHAFYIVWVCALICAMYHGNLLARRLS